MKTVISRHRHQTRSQPESDRMIGLLVLLDRIMEMSSAAAAKVGLAEGEYAGAGVSPCSGTPVSVPLSDIAGGHT
ncbi:hypothetical protein [Arthrobacter sp. Leaf234]|uniref:hypothetical protein n=1 Tax=Arthrobacter sp. Leaf234 TaxID=1736303 RepID=UPI0012FCA3EB|nr:hypothetical protein [Arthrobacter sp. Leaf234]